MGFLRTRVFVFREGDRSGLPEGNSLGVSLGLLDRQYNLEQTPHQGTTILNYRSLNKSFFEGRMELFELFLHILLLNRAGSFDWKLSNYPKSLLSAILLKVV